MGPRRAAEVFRSRLPRRPSRVVVTLYGSLAATGKGHMTDAAVTSVLGDVPVEFLWRSGQTLTAHPNGMVFRAFDGPAEIASWRVYSIGGGSLADDAGPVEPALGPDYPAANFREVLAWCHQTGQPIWAYAAQYESGDLWQRLGEIWTAMRQAVEAGLRSGQPSLPGPLGLGRRAAETRQIANERVGYLRDLNLLSAYALAVAEGNASGGQVVTAPTCGSSGVLPAVLYYYAKHHQLPERRLLESLATAAIFGTLVAQRASISGAEVGCQGEIGTACAMAAGAVAQLLGGTPNQVEYAAEMGMEHCLGLTCDPIAGLVQVPCIERNAFAAMRAVECAAYALATDGRHLVTFDDVVDVMNATGRDLQSKYRETAAGGLAQIMRGRLGAAPSPTSTIAECGLRNAD
jgi:L-serine dehydratase